MNKEDLRVKRTNRLLREAFIQLILENDYEKVTVRDITTVAQVGYKTFYRHYESKEVLLNAILADLIASLRETLDYSFQSSPPTENLITTLEFTKANANLFLALAKSPASEQLLHPMFQAALEEGSLAIRNMDVPKDIATFHFASSIDTLIKWWLKNDFPYSVNEMASYINKLILFPIESLDQQEKDKSV